MTRFDATDPSARRDLVADAVRAHRDRDSPYLTVEGDGGAPWLQYADGEWNLDCTDAELERLTDVLAEFPSFVVADLTSPEEIDGTNVRIEARAGPDRLAQFAEEVLRETYGFPEDGRLWAAEV